MNKMVGRVAALVMMGTLIACGGGVENPGGTQQGGPGATSGDYGGGVGGAEWLETSGVGGGSAGGGPDGQEVGESCDGKFTGRVRDFHDTHPDMEPAHSGKCDSCDDHEIVTDELGQDLKPIYAGGATGTQTTTGKEAFDQWFRDVEGVNSPMNITLQFVESEQPGVWTYDNQLFFPVDDQLFGNEGREHNYHFTFEMHMGFEYQGGEEFTFAGDDDVFTYINGKKVVDLGGIHPQQTEVVRLDELGLEIGKKYQLDFFFAERHVTDSHFRIDTTIKFINCGLEVK
ncbi:hypothetical protein SOCE26_091800 [Sorangium cellulosum]|uniref:PA14 domain-containing protein n=1 Tax=Sorangium cellulosum TaxID=56 RepID=A0A2L0F7U0_SORCE|nr:fibro-slime domain-containing protein [Sorangium cellulosum]AUX47658.1 hypothetical protein SOCE26_091800 [Sorangium cellulosum]